LDLSQFFDRPIVIFYLVVEIGPGIVGRDDRIEVDLLDHKEKSEAVIGQIIITPTAHPSQQIVTDLNLAPSKMKSCLEVS